MKASAINCTGFFYLKSHDVGHGDALSRKSLINNDL